VRPILFKWELAGTIVIIAMGVLLHFVFEWSGCYKPLALIAAVNESTWEHLKLAFWPALIWAALESFALGKQVPNQLVAKTASFYTAPIMIVALVNGYTAISGKHILALDISIFMLSVIGAQIVSYLLLRRRRFCPMARLFGLCLLALILSAFCTFTYFPPQLPLFIDPTTGLTGIICLLE